MEFKTQISWGSRNRLNELKSKLDCSVKKPKRSTLNEFFPREQNRPIAESGTPSSKFSDYSSSNYSYYTNIEKFRTFSGMNNLKRSASSAYSPLASPKKTEKNGFFSKVDSLFPKNPRESDKKSLDEILTTKMLDKALSLIRKGKVNNEEFSYCRKLRSTCLLLLDNLNL